MFSAIQVAKQLFHCDSVPVLARLGLRMTSVSATDHLAELVERGRLAL